MEKGSIMLRRSSIFVAVLFAAMLFAVVFIGIGSVQAAEEVYLPEPEIVVENGPYIHGQVVSLTISSPGGAEIMLFRVNEDITSLPEGCYILEDTEGVGFNSMSCEPGSYVVYIKIRETSASGELYVTVGFEGGLVSNTAEMLTVRTPSDDEPICSLYVAHIGGLRYRVNYSWINGIPDGPHVLTFGTSGLEPVLLDGTESAGALSVDLPYVSRMMYEVSFSVLGYPDRFVKCKFPVVMPDKMPSESSTIYIPLAAAPDAPVLAVSD